MRSLFRFRSRRSYASAIAAMLIVIVATVWLTGGASALANARIAKALAERRLRDAEEWTLWAESVGLSNAETTFLHARLFRRFGQLDEAADWLKRANAAGVDRARLEREAVLLTAQGGRVAEVQSKLAELLIDQQGDGADVCEAFANGWLMMGDREQAVRLIDEWQSAYPDDPQATYVRGRAAQFYGHRSAAIEQYEDALRKQPGHRPAAFALARLRREDQLLMEARQLFEQCLDMRYPGAAMTEFARCLRANGDTDEAQSLFEEVAVLPVADIELSYRRLGVRMQGRPAIAELGEIALTNRDFESALDWLETAYAADPTNLEVRYNRAQALKGAGRGDEARVEMAEVLRRKELSARVLLLRAEVDLDQPDVEKRLELARIYVDDGLSDEMGEFWLKSILGFVPDHRIAHRMLAEIYDRRATNDPAYETLAAEHRRQAASKP